MSTRIVTQAAPSSGQRSRWPDRGEDGTRGRHGVPFNFSPEKVGILWSATDGSTSTPVLAPRFQSYLFWLNLWWGLGLSLPMARLLLRQWAAAIRWMDLALRVFGSLVLSAMVLGVPFIEAPTASTAIKGILALVVVGMLSQVLRQFNRLLGGRRLIVELRSR